MTLVVPMTSAGKMLEEDLVTEESQLSHGYSPINFGQIMP